MSEVLGIMSHPIWTKFIHKMQDLVKLEIFMYVQNTDNETDITISEF